MSKMFRYCRRDLIELPFIEYERIRNLDTPAATKDGRRGEVLETQFRFTDLQEPYSCYWGNDEKNHVLNEKARVITDPSTGNKYLGRDPNE